MNTDLSKAMYYDIFRLFSDFVPVTFEIINTSRSDSDFREVIIAENMYGEKYVIKLADNDFTFPERIEMWKRTAEEYRRIGYYCPVIMHDKTGYFPIVHYKERNCVAYAEEYAIYSSAEQREKISNSSKIYAKEYKKDAWIMTAKIAAKHFDYSDYPSGFCLFDTFCPSDKTDEVLENALNWKKYAEALPEIFQVQVERIWSLWVENRNSLKEIYKKLPTSIFQADLNPSNILLDDSGNFVGVYDFNLCGKDTLLNYLFREIYYTDFYQEIEQILSMLKTVSKYYSFSEDEKNTALMLYRCVKPLWYNRLQKLKALKDDYNSIGIFLNETEHFLTEPIDFSFYMA